MGLRGTTGNECEDAINASGSQRSVGRPHLHEDACELALIRAAEGSVLQEAWIADFLPAGQGDRVRGAKSIQFHGRVFEKLWKSEAEQVAEALNAKLEALQHDHDQQQQILLQERARQDRKLAKERAQEDAERGQALELRRRQLIDSASPLVAPPKRRTGRPRNDEKPWVVVPVVKRLRGRPRKVRN